MNLFLILLFLISIPLAARNPFILPHYATTHTAIRNSLTLEGIVHCEGEKHAVLRYGIHSAIVPVHGNFEGYYVSAIEKDFVIVQKNTSVQKLSLE